MYLVSSSSGNNSYRNGNIANNKILVPASDIIVNTTGSNDTLKFNVTLTSG